MASAYHKRHDYFVAALNAIEGFECRPGEGAFYAFPRIEGVLEARGMRDDIELVEFLLNEADLACVPGSAFGAPSYVRFSFACSMEMLEESIRRIKRAVMA
jgi:aspartate aminotransferase